MTTEEKARAYEAVLERAKQLKEHNKDDEALNKWLCKTFPELAESEDEKIRKALIDVLNSDFEKDTEIHGITVGAIIAWLEKQKVNPFSGISFEYNGDIWGMCARDNGIDVLLNGNLISHIDKNKKQEWGEKDK